MIVNPKVYCSNDNLKFNLTADDVRFIGIILTGGHINHEKGRKRCHITIKYKRKKTIEFVKKYIDNIGIHYSIDKKEESYKIVFTCTTIEWLNRLYFYDINKQKIIADEFKKLPNDLLIELLRGMIENGGAQLKKEKHNTNSVRYTSSSIRLIYDIMYICRKFNMVVGGNIVTEKGSPRCINGNEFVSKHTRYTITFPLQFKEVLHYFGYSDEVLTNGVKFFNVHNGRSLERIIRLEEIEVNSIVYDINIKNKNYIHTFNGVIG